MSVSTPSPRSDRWLWILLILLIGAILVAVAVKVRPLLDPQVAVLAPLDPGCDLAAVPCTVRLPGGGAVRLEIEPKGIPASTPLKLRAWVSGIAANAVEVDFAGVDMNMGYNRPALKPVGVEGDRALFEGPGMLPICVRDRMAWEARVLLHTPAGLLAAPFRFETSR